MVVFFSFAVLVLAAVAAAASPQPVNYKDASLPVEERVSDLLSRMTIEEKTAQLIQGSISQRYTQFFCMLATGEHGTYSTIKW